MRTLRLIASATALTMLLSGCGIIGAAEDSDDDKCGEVDQSLVDDIMSQARSDFTTSQDLEVDRLEPVDAASVPLDADQQQFGVERLLAVRALVVYGGELADPEFSGVEVVFFFGVDDNDKVVVPVDSKSQEFFDVPVPEGAESWRRQADRSPVALEASGCVNPDR